LSTEGVLLRIICSETGAGPKDFCTWARLTFAAKKEIATNRANDKIAKYFFVILFSLF
jgi:hypothetical protein